MSINLNLAAIPGLSFTRQQGVSTGPFQVLVHSTGQWFTLDISEGLSNDLDTMSPGSLHWIVYSEGQCRILTIGCSKEEFADLSRNVISLINVAAIDPPIILIPVTTADVIKSNQSVKVKPIFRDFEMLLTLTTTPLGGKGIHVERIEQ